MEGFLIFIGLLQMTVIYLPVSTLYVANVTVWNLMCLNDFYNSSDEENRKRNKIHS